MKIILYKFFFDYFPKLLAFGINQHELKYTRSSNDSIELIQFVAR